MVSSLRGFTVNLYLEEAAKICSIKGKVVSSSVGSAATLLSTYLHSVFTSVLVSILELAYFIIFLLLLGVEERLSFLVMDYTLDVKDLV